MEMHTTMQKPSAMRWQKTRLGVWSLTGVPDTDTAVCTGRQEELAAGRVAKLNPLVGGRLSLSREENLPRLSQVPADDLTVLPGPREQR